MSAQQQPMALVVLNYHWSKVEMQTPQGQVQCISYDVVDAAYQPVPPQAASGNGVRILITYPEETGQQIAAIIAKQQVVVAKQMPQL